VLGIKLKPTMRENKNFQVYKHRSNQNDVQNNMRVKASTESYAENKNLMKICDEAVDHDGVDKMMQENKKMTNFDHSFLQSDKVMHEEWNDAVILNGEMVLDTNNDEQTDEPERKSNDSDSDETMLQNNETMVLEADFLQRRH